MFKILVGVSGSGRSLENFLSKQDKSYRVAAVVASNRHCRAVQIAEREKLPLLVWDGRASEGDAQLTEFCQEHQIDLICLAGFLKKFPLLPGYEDRTFNIHPALLPRYGGKGMYGARVHQAVLAGGEKESGATIHRVSEVYDAGEILVQERVPIHPQDTAESLAMKVFEVEKKIYPEFIQNLSKTWPNSIHQRNV